MESKITSKYQTTIPKLVRDKLKINISDVLEWKMEGSKIYVETASNPFLKYKASIPPIGGSTKTDILKARKARASRYA